MGKIKLLFDRKKHYAMTNDKEHTEPIIEGNLYTILGFRSREDFENKTRKFVNKKIWQSFIDCFAKEINYPAIEEVVKSVVRSIAKSDRSDAFTKTEHLILNEKRDNKKREKAIRKAIGILRKINSEKAFNELSIIKKQAEDFSQTDFCKAQSKPLQGFAPSGGQLFVETLKYIKTLEKLAEVKKEESVKVFLLYHISSLNKKYPELRNEREDAIAILSNDEFKNLYDKGVKEGILFPMASYKKCKNLYDEMNQAKNESKGVIEREEQLQKTDQSTISIINDIKRCREAILYCKSFRNSYIMEKEVHPFRGNACQKMIDIYQERIVGYQEKIRQNLREIFESMLQEMGSCDVEEFEKIMDGVHKAEQTGEKLDSALICSLNTQSDLNIQLKKMENPQTELKAACVNVETELACRESTRKI